MFFIAAMFGSVLPFSQSDTVRAEYPKSFPNSNCVRLLLFLKFFIVSATFFIYSILADFPPK